MPAQCHTTRPHHGSAHSVEHKVPEGAEVGEHLLEEVPLQADVGRQVRHLHDITIIVKRQLRQIVISLC